MAAILKTFAGLNFYTRTCFIDYYHISFKKSHQTLRPRSCRVNQNFDISWILDLGLPVTIVQKQEELSFFSDYCRGILITERSCMLICMLLNFQKPYVQ